ncbi:hypothetical protein WICPIJ_004333 [Wickerhamomyces pijperi]|uniref:Uncharacterized protein n=1 Tax=Wickerhamomyces pijperi TaxID=599730 RepID=A0A9P8Q5U6_WICPI|nr:hypothetical protein WICPIJ_004333 [Wickerhamomyces pijperi]
MSLSLRLLTFRATPQTCKLTPKVFNPKLEILSVVSTSFVVMCWNFIFFNTALVSASVERTSIKTKSCSDLPAFNSLDLTKAHLIKSSKIPDFWYTFLIPKPQILVANLDLSDKLVTGEIETRAIGVSLNSIGVFPDDVCEVGTHHKEERGETGGKDQNDDKLIQVPLDQRETTNTVEFPQLNVTKDGNSDYYSGYGNRMCGDGFDGWSLRTSTEINGQVQSSVGQVWSKFGEV